MDKWKEEELERMKAGGNAMCTEFLENQPDFRANWSFEEKYHSKAAGESLKSLLFISIKLPSAAS
jgi:ADP-ribosylation factor GTPase-activating protein 1